MRELFDNNLFLIAYGVIFWYVLLWSFAKNKISKLRKERLKMADSEAEKALIMQDDKYKFNFKEWISDNSDEIIISVMSALLLISFDTVFAELINRKFFADDPIELGKTIYLLGGIVGDILYRAVSKLKG